MSDIYSLVFTYFCEYFFTILFYLATYLRSTPNTTLLLHCLVVFIIFLPLRVLIFISFWNILLVLSTLLVFSIVFHLRKKTYAKLFLQSPLYTSSPYFPTMVMDFSWGYGIVSTSIWWKAIPYVHLRFYHYKFSYHSLYFLQISSTAQFELSHSVLLYLILILS